jgi:hypothetical protein
MLNEWKTKKAADKRREKLMMTIDNESKKLQKDSEVFSGTEL